MIPKPILNVAMEYLLSVHYGDLNKFGLKPDHDFFKAHPTVNDGVIAQIQTGKVKVNRNVKEFEGNIVTFEDGTKITVDNVIHCTGYKVETPFLDSSILGKREADSNRVQLYKHIFPASYENIAFIGFVQPPAAIFPFAEMQARYATSVFAGQFKLPSKKDRRDAIDIEWMKHCMDYIPRERHTIQVDASYLEHLASLIGCQVYRFNKA
jgi:dimethylaniline monooxygenase (N-oxide forming)